MKVALLHNLDAGDQETTAAELRRVLRRHGHQPIPLRGRRLARFFRGDVSAILEEMVVVAGGDGSVKRAALALAGSGIPLALIPLGTANNIAHSLGIAGQPAEVVRGWRTAEVRALDLGMVRGPWGERRFIESVGVGLIGRAIAILDRVAEISQRVLATREDRLHRDVTVLLALTHELQPVPLRLRTDARHGPLEKFLLCEIMNIRHSGPGVELSRSADSSDGFLDLVTVKAGERGKLITHLERCLADKLPAPLLRTQRVREVSLSIGNHEVRVDDEVVWPTITPTSPRLTRTVKISIGVEAGALRCLLPPRAARE